MVNAAARVLPMGERALLLEVDSLDEVTPLHARSPPPAPDGVVDLVPAARTVLVRVEPRCCSPWPPRARGPRGGRGCRIPSPTPGPLVELAVVYDGADLDETAELLGIERRRAGAPARRGRVAVAFTGFAPGFGYLVSADWPFDVPRLASPRTRVPAGAVGLAGGFTGAYPRDTPGGWRLIGTTIAPLFDPDAASPALLAPGTRVRFRAVTAAGAAVPGESPGTGRRGAHARSARGSAGPRRKQHPHRRTRPSGNVQDLGRRGRGVRGRRRLGSARPRGPPHREPPGRKPRGSGRDRGHDGRAARRGRGRSVGRRDRAPGASSASAGGRSTPTRRTRGRRAPSCTWTGSRMARGRTSRCAAGSTRVRCSAPVRPICSRGSDPRRSAPVTSSGRDDARVPIPVAPPAPWGAPHDDELELELAPGPRADWFAPDALPTLYDAVWTVSNHADRVGARLDGPELARVRTGELPSEGMVPGALQVPPSGRPTILLADGPVTGGYPVIAVVTDAALDLIAQARPGTRIRFRHARSSA